MFGRIINGAVAGVAGGIPFGIMMSMMGSIKMIASMVGSQSIVVGWLIHLMISAGIGASYALITARHDLSRNGHFLAGTGYGAIWWVLGPLTMMPLMMGMPLGWNLATATKMLPSLFGHLVFGIVLGLTYSRLALGRLNLAEVHG